MRRAMLVALMGCAALSARPASARPGFWERAADPHRERVDGLVARAKAELGERPLPGGSLEPAARAEIWMREALRLDPKSFPATAVLGEALARLGRGAEAARVFAAARALAPTPADAAACSLRMAIQASRAGRYADALIEYDHHIRLGEAQSVAYTNSAEILMAMGRLGEAQDRYREAVRIEEQANPGRGRDENLALALYGLAVALDRDDQSLAAREAVARAVALDGKLSLLESARDEGGDVFFVPAGDVHYYRGLALMFVGRQREATQAFERFLADQRDGRWAKRAEAHLLAMAAGEAPVAKPRVKLIAFATLRAQGPIAAPLVDAAWKSRPALLEPCLELVPATAGETARIPVEIEFDAGGAPARIALPPTEGWGPFSSCVETRVKDGLRVAKPSKAQPTTVRVELVLGIRR